jgi:acetyltransferase-like isoleucine patch superfamily enzyme
MLIDYLKKLRDLYLVKVRWRKYKIGKGFHAGARVSLWARDTLTIGEHFYIGRDSLIETDCIIGNHVMLGNKVALIGRYDHNFQQPGTPIRFASQVRDNDYKWRGLHDVIIVEDDVWIGYGTVVMGGVWIGAGSIIASGSIVTRDVEPYSIYAGSPAVKLKDRFDSIEDLEKHKQLYKLNYQ